MATKRELMEANYVHPDVEEYNSDINLCGLPPCDHSKMIKDEKTGEKHRYCMKLQIPVEEYDFCKYHSDEEWTKLIGEMGSLLQIQDEAIKAGKRRKRQKYWMIASILVVLAVLVYALIK